MTPLAVRGRSWRRLLLATILLGGLGPGRTAAAEDPPPAPDWYPINHWDRRTGMPPGGISAMLQTRDGYMWVATRAGVARFDGLRFTVFDDRDPRQLPENEVKALAEGDDGSLWIATYGGGVSRLLGGRFKVFRKQDGLASDFVVTLCRDREGAIWFGTDEGLTRYHQGRFQSFRAAEGVRGPTNHLYSDADGTLWVALSNGGLLHSIRSGSGLRFVEHTLEDLPAGINVWNIVRGPDRALWLGTHEGLFRIKDSVVKRFDTADGLAGRRTTALHVDRGGDLWVVASDGLHRLAGERFHRFEGLETERGLSLVTSDAEGSIWINLRGLTLLRRGQFVSYTTNRGLSYHYATSLAEDADGHVWVGTGRGLNRVGGGPTRVFGPESGLARALIGAVAVDPQQRLWVGTDAGLYRSAEPVTGAGAVDRLRFEQVPGQPPGLQARGLFVDRQGTLWIAGLLQGLVRHRAGEFTQFTTRDGLLHDAVRGIREDRAGNLWMGTRAGLNRLKDGRFTGYTQKDGLAHPTIEALAIDEQDALWIGTRQGVTRFKDGRFTTYKVNDGMLANYVSGFATDSRGNLWMGSSRGLFFVPLAQLQQFALGQLPALRPTSYGVEHGLPSMALNAGFDRLIVRTRDDRMWFAMNRGVAITDPGRLFENDRPPPVHIQEVEVDHHAYLPATEVEAPPGRGELSFRYAGLSFVAPEKVRFQHMLEGYDRDWVEGDDTRGARYNNIAPGRYRFRVIAANNEGVWNMTGAALTVRLRPHWYQTWLFRATVLGLALALAAGLYRNHVRLLTRRQRLLEQRVAERTAELASANQELDAFTRSVSHDLRAPLRAIKGFTQEVLQQQADLEPENRALLGRVEGAAQRMAVLIEDLLALSRSARADLERAPVSLTELAEEIVTDLRRHEPGRQVVTTVAPNLVAHADPSLVRVVLQNLLGNAWKFTSKRSPAHIEVGVTGEGDAVAGAVYHVRDDGAGFDPSLAHGLFVPFKRLHPSSQFEGTGIGLATVRRIVERHGGKVWAESQPDHGATFYFTLPPTTPP